MHRFAELITTLLIGICAGLALGGMTELEFRLYDWQTLIAGILAVGAAAITLFEMRRTEAAQGKRHNDLLRLSLRQDRMTIERCSARAVGCRTMVVSYNEWLAAVAADPTCLKLWPILRNIVDRFVSLQTFDDAKSLFPPEMHHRFLSINRFHGKLTDMVAAYTSGGSPMSVSRQLRRAKIVVERLTDHLTVFANELEALRKEFEIAEVRH